MKAYHLTTRSNLYGEDGIIEKGLIPQCGKRSKSVGDNRVGVCFINNYYTLKVWWLSLYPHEDPNNLCVLTFDVPEDQAINWQNETEFITESCILPERINLATFCDKDTNEQIPFYYLQEGAKKNIGWGFSSEDIEIEVLESPIIATHERNLDNATLSEKKLSLNIKSSNNS